MEKTACLIVDVQQAATAPLPDGGEGVTKRLSHLIGWCRQADGAAGLCSAGSRGGEVSPIDPRIQPREGELVLDKSYSSAFLETSWRISATAGHYPVDCSGDDDRAVRRCQPFNQPSSAVIRCWCRRDAAPPIIIEYLTAEQAEAYYEQKIWQGRYAQVFSLDDLLTQATR